MRKLIPILALVLAPLYADSAPNGPEAGAVHFFLSTSPAFTRYTDAPGATIQNWLRTHFWRMLVYSPYFDNRLAWYPNGIVYIDAYAIYTNSAIAQQHPEWILKDADGNNLYIPWGCGQGSCPQYAADFSNPAFRQWWLTQAQGLLANGYKGLFVDDVNMDFRAGDGWGNPVTPIDPNTGSAMNPADWRRYLASFTAQIRASFPNTEIIHNAIWYAGPAGIRDQDFLVSQELAAADYVSIEFGVNDPGLTGGTSEWSLNALLTYIDRLHTARKGAIIDGVPNDSLGREYALANYFLISNGMDAIGNRTATPDNWWNGFNTNLGTPNGPRTFWAGMLRRDFSGGIVLVNPPQSGWVTIPLPGNFQRTDGVIVNTVTLGPSQGAVLLSVTPQ